MRARRAALTTLAGAATLWLAAPVVALVRHGSIDDRTRAAWTGEVPAAPTARLLPLPHLPAPRPAADDLVRVSTPDRSTAARGVG